MRLLSALLTDRDRRIALALVGVKLCGFAAKCLRYCSRSSAASVAHLKRIAPTIVSATFISLCVAASITYCYYTSSLALPSSEVLAINVILLGSAVVVYAFGLLQVFSDHTWVAGGASASFFAILAIAKGLRDRTARNSKCALAYAKRGDIYAKNGDHDRAIANYSKVIEIDPNCDVAYAIRGDVFTRKGDYDRALIDYSNVIEINPNYTGAYAIRGDIYARMGDDNRAIQDYDNATRINPRDSVAYAIRGAAYARKGDNERAISDYSKAIEINPRDAAAYNCRAVAYFNCSNAVKGLHDANKSLQLRPDHLNALDTRGHILEALGRIDEATADFRHALSKNANLGRSR